MLRASPAKVPSVFFVADALLEMNRITGNRLIQPREGTDMNVLQMAIAEAGKVKKLVSHLRYLCRSGNLSARHPTILRMKAIYQKKLDKPEADLETVDDGDEQTCEEAGDEDEHEVHDPALLEAELNVAADMDDDDADVAGSFVACVLETADNATEDVDKVIAAFGLEDPSDEDDDHHEPSSRTIEINAMRLPAPQRPAYLSEVMNMLEVDPPSPADPTAQNKLAATKKARIPKQVPKKTKQKPKARHATFRRVGKRLRKKAASVAGEEELLSDAESGRKELLADAEGREEELFAGAEREEQEPLVLSDEEELPDAEGDEDDLLKELGLADAAGDGDELADAQVGEEAGAGLEDVTTTTTNMLPLLLPLLLVLLLLLPLLLLPPLLLLLLLLLMLLLLLLPL